MKAIIKVEKEVDIRTLRVEAHVRYWEDGHVEGVEDSEDGDHMPCKEGDMWKPVIDLESGRIKNWEQGKVADVHFKVCDEGSYYLEDQHGSVVGSIERDYVPGVLCPEERGYGDYIIMHINADGKIRGFEMTQKRLNDFLMHGEE